jgi:pimeloyl-ACP methyl ester carboxylesterase
VKPRALALALLVWLCAASVARAEPPFSEVSRASGARAGHPRGYVITIHPGGWNLVGAGMAGLMHPEVARLNSWGYETLNVDHRRGAAGLTDVTRFYDRLRARVGTAPICLDAWSSGGHLAMMVASTRPGVACVISVAGPTYLPTLRGRLGQLARRFFGRHGGLLRWSPAARRIRTPLLLAYARADTVVPFEQSSRMLRADPLARRVALGKGSAPYVHGTVDRSDLRAFVARERRFLRRYEH